MTDEECTSIFMDLLRYVPYLKHEKVNIQRFISGFLAAFKDQIDFNEPQSLEEPIKKLNHGCEHSSVILSLIRIRKGMRILNESGLRSKEYCRMRVTRIT